MKQNVLIAGATSAIGQATARLLAKDACSFFLVARDSIKLDAVVSDLRARGAERVETLIGDLNDRRVQKLSVERSVAALGNLDLFLLFFGTLSDQAQCEHVTDRIAEELTTNFVSAATLLNDVARPMEARRSGTIAVVSSVAGDRGRKSNYIYGSAKAGLTAYLEGLRNRLFVSGVHVLTIKPGIVDTPMTENLKSRPLVVGPARVARDIYRAVQRKKDVIYTPLRWKFVMCVIRKIPERLFKRMNF